MCGVRFVLWHHHKDIDTFILICIDKFSKIFGVSLKILRLHIKRGDTFKTHSIERSTITSYLYTKT